MLLTPAQRADVVVEPRPADGEDEVALRFVPYDRGTGTAFNRPVEDVLRLRFTHDVSVQNPPLPALGRQISSLDVTGARPVDISLTVGQDATGHLEMGINGVPSRNAEHVMAAVGQRQLWTITNTFEFDHPFHLHGYFFQVLDVNGRTPAQREWHDTVNVPVNGTLRFVVDFDSRPGMWMFHCHILDHADAGMMGMVHVQ